MRKLYVKLLILGVLMFGTVGLTNSIPNAVAGDCWQCPTFDDGYVGCVDGYNNGGWDCIPMDAWCIMHPGCFLIEGD